jgi:glycosyltransferase involved in cell wall biosynthesis
LRAERTQTGRSSKLAEITAGVLSRIERRALRRANGVVVLSEFSRRILEKKHREPSSQIAIIPGGVDLQHFRPSTDRMAVRDELGLPRDVPLLVTIRDLEQRMGIETLLAAMADLIKGRKYFCVIGGSGPLRSFLGERASRLGIGDHVRFAGHIPEKHLPLYYQAADLFVLPTLTHEGFGLVTVEALACGTPVAATPAGATPEILAPLDSRLLAEDTTAEALATAIARSFRLAENDAFRRRCRAHAEERYSWKKHIDAFEEEIYRVRRPNAAGSK